MLYTLVALAASIAAAYFFWNDLSTMLTRILPGFNPVVFAAVFIMIIGGIVYAMTR